MVNDKVLETSKEMYVEQKCLIFYKTLKGKCLSVPVGILKDYNKLKERKLCQKK